MTDQKWYVWIWIQNFKCYVILLIPCIPWSNQMIHSPNNFNTFSGLLKRFWVRGLWYKVGSTKQFHSHQCHASVLNIEPWAFRRVSWLIWQSCSTPEKSFANSQQRSTTLLAREITFGVLQVKGLFWELIWYGSLKF